MKNRHNSHSGSNGDKEFVNMKKHTEKKDSFHVPVDARVQSWDPTPDTAEEMVNTYGTYEIQATADTLNMFPALSQGLPSETIAEIPKHFHEGIVPKLND